MKKHRAKSQATPAVALPPTVAVIGRPLPAPRIPTGNPRHAGKVREGKISYEVFSRKARETIPIDFDVVNIEVVRERRRRAKVEVREGSKESSRRDAEAVRHDEGRVHLLREGKQKRSREDNAREGQ